jgi:RNA-directed DNA polymerase
MKVSYGEGLATRTDPESCVAVRKDGGEALTGERAGRVLSREMIPPWRELRVLRGADALRRSGRPYRTHRHREARPDPARSETPRMLGRTAHGNREIPRSSPGQPTGDRIAKSKDVR